MTDVILNKLQTIRRCLTRINEEYSGDPANLENITKQDAIVLNLQRACEACISLAMHVVSSENAGVPQSSRDAFEMLAKAEVINDGLAARMKAMVGFRNIAVHDYQAVKVEIIRTVIEDHLGDFIEFSDSITQFKKS